MARSDNTNGQRSAPASGLDARAPASRRARLRAAVIAYFVLFNALAALPLPGEATAERLQRPFEREELRRWAGMFRAVGIDVAPERLARGYLSFSIAVERARALVLWPIEDWFELTQTGQNWNLFGSPGRTINALRVVAHSPSGDEILYESGDEARRFEADFLEYRRIRAAYKPSRRGPPATYFAFAEHLSRQIFAALPHVDRVTLGFVQRRVRLPGEASAPDGSGEPRLEHALSFERSGA